MQITTKQNRFLDRVVTGTGIYSSIEIVPINNKTDKEDEVPQVRYHTLLDRGSYGDGLDGDLLFTTKDQLKNTP